LPEVVAQPVQNFSGEGVHMWADALAAGIAPGPHTAGPDDLSLFPYSSGTTGAPHGCMHTHSSLIATLVQRVSCNPLTDQSTTLATLPFFHVTGLQASMNGPIYSGGTSVIMTRWDRKVAAELIQRYRISSWRNISTMVIDFLSDPDIRNYDLSSLVAIGGGGAAMPAAVEEKLFELTGLRYLEGYGLSETMAGTHINPPDAPK